MTSTAMEKDKSHRTANNRGRGRVVLARAGIKIVSFLVALKP